MTTPSFVDPQTVLNPTSGQALSAAWCDQVRDDIMAIAQPPGCVVRRDSGQTISNSTLTAVSFTTADDRDTDGFHDTSSNPTRITVPTGMGGWYDCRAVAFFTANSTGQRLLEFRVNGTTEYRGTYVTNSGGSISANVHYAADIFLAAGDYVEVMVYQNSGGNLDLVAGGASPWCCRASFRRVAVT